MSLNLINFPHRADSSFTGRRSGNITVESVHRRTPTNGVLSNNDYAAVLRHDNGTRAVVPYSRLLGALRAVNAEPSVAALFREAQNSGQVTAAVAAPVPKSPLASGPLIGYAGATTVAAPPAPAPKAPVNTATEAARQAQLGTIINGETALDLMTALVKAARQDPKVAQIVKSLSALV